MALTTTHMGLAVWDQDSDAYDHDALAGNWERVDSHDHASNGGAPLPPEALPTITSTNIGDGAVGTNKLADHAVTEAKLAIPAVGTPELYNDSVTNAKIANNAVDAAQIANDAVTGPKIADTSSSTGAAIQAGHINNGAIASRHISDASISSAKLSSNAVHTGNVQDGTITSSKIADNAVTTDSIKGSAVTAPKLALGSITPPKFGAIPAVFVKTNTSKDISVGETHVFWDLSVYDTDNMWNSSLAGRITIQTAGIWVLTGSVYWQDHESAPDNSGRRRITLRCNDSNLAGSGPSSLNEDWRTFNQDTGSPIGSSVQALHQTASITIALNIGDQIDLAIFSDYDGSQYLPNDSSTHLSATWLAPRPDSP
jgi:hypothetical protein